MPSWILLGWNISLKIEWKLYVLATRVYVQASEVISAGLKTRDDFNFLTWLPTHTQNRKEERWKWIGKAVQKSLLFQPFPVKMVPALDLLRDPRLEQLKKRQLTCWCSGSTAILYCGYNSRQKFQQTLSPHPPLCLVESEMQGILGTVVFRMISGKSRHCFKNYSKRTCTH